MGYKLGMRITLIYCVTGASSVASFIEHIALLSTFVGNLMLDWDVDL